MTEVVKDSADGYGFDFGPVTKALGSQCSGAKTIVTFRFAKDLVSQTTETLITGYKAASSSILTMMRRVGDCPG